MIAHLLISIYHLLIMIVHLLISIAHLLIMIAYLLISIYHLLIMIAHFANHDRTLLIQYLEPVKIMSHDRRFTLSPALRHVPWLYTAHLLVQPSFHDLSFVVAYSMVPKRTHLFFFS